MVAYRRVYDSRHLQADCQEPGSDPEPYSPQSSVGYLYLLPYTWPVAVAPPPVNKVENIDLQMADWL